MQKVLDDSDNVGGIQVNRRGSTGAWWDTLLHGASQSNCSWIHPKPKRGWWTIVGLGHSRKKRSRAGTISWGGWGLLTTVGNSFSCFTSLLLPVFFLCCGVLGDSIKERDAMWLGKLVRQAGSELSMEMGSMVTVEKRRTLYKLLCIMDNDSGKSESTARQSIRGVCLVLSIKHIDRSIYLFALFHTYYEPAIG